MHVPDESFNAIDVPDVHSTGQTSIPRASLRSRTAAARAQFVLEGALIRRAREVRMHTKDTIRTLNRLIRVCRNVEAFCDVAADGAAGGDVSAVLRHRGDEWGRLGDELQALVLLLGGEPARSATFAARAQHLALAARLATLGPADAMVIGAWRGIERQAESRYVEALEGYLPERIRRTVSLQAERVVGRAVQIGGPLEEAAVHSLSP